jgi:hypothetical protein
MMQQQKLKKNKISTGVFIVYEELSVDLTGRMEALINRREVKRQGKVTCKQQ